MSLILQSSLGKRFQVLMMVCVTKKILDQMNYILYYLVLC